MTRVDDPTRAAVERWLQAMIDAALAAPTEAVRAIDACLRRRMNGAREIVEQPLRLARSLFDVMAGVPAPPYVPPRRRIVDAEAADVAPPQAVTVEETDVADMAAEELPIEEYESLAASHVVARLEGLSPSELRRVQRFEAAHRGRRTVLGKIDQLLVHG